MYEFIERLNDTTFNLLDKESGKTLTATDSELIQELKSGTKVEKCKIYGGTLRILVGDKWVCVERWRAVRDPELTLPDGHFIYEVSDCGNLRRVPYHGAYARTVTNYKPIKPTTRRSGHNHSYNLKGINGYKTYYANDLIRDAFANDDTSGFSKAAAVTDTTMPDEESYIAAIDNCDDENSVDALNETTVKSVDYSETICMVEDKLNKLGYAHASLSEMVLRILEGEYWENLELTKAGIAVRFNTGERYEVPVEVWKKIPMKEFETSKGACLMASSLGNFKYSGYFDARGCWIDTYTPDLEEYFTVKRLEKGLVLILRGKKYSVARLVATTFFGDVESIERETSVRVAFKDGDRFNCCAYNLEWDFNTDAIFHPERYSKDCVVRYYNRNGEIEHQYQNAESAAFGIVCLNLPQFKRVGRDDIYNWCSKGTFVDDKFAVRFAANDELFELSKEERVKRILKRSVASSVTPDIKPTVARIVPLGGSATVAPSNEKVADNPKKDVSKQKKDRKSYIKPEDLVADYRWIRQYDSTGIVLTAFETLEDVAKSLKVPVRYVMEFCKRGMGTLQGYAFRWSDDDELLDMSINERVEVFKKAQGYFDTEAKVNEEPNKNDKVPLEIDASMLAPLLGTEHVHVRMYNKNKLLVGEFASARRAAEAINGDYKEIVKAYQKRTEYKGYLFRIISNDELYSGSKKGATIPFVVDASSDESSDKDADSSGIDNMKRKKKPAPKDACRAVRKYDKQGNFIAEYPSMRMAALSVGGCVKDVSHVCKGIGYSVRGFQFRFASDNLDSIPSYIESASSKANYSGIKRTVRQFTKDGKFVREYDSADEAAEVVGCSAGSIRDACSGRLKSACGFTFKYGKPSKVRSSNRMVHRFTLGGIYEKTYDSIAAAAEDVGLSATMVSFCCSGKNTRAGNHIFLYASDCEASDIDPNTRKNLNK